ncbi:putative oxidoreductase [Pseudolycoriella hygida]|uniref:Oxidoreductase n=1 Tax=Pseudolycoriella hygida TaxID=35572 RepID=A0A9Q0MNC6_9DIPT|nr:putative oxidoreductase [Pseudolycoriella hygida]
MSPVDILVNNAGIVPMLSLREGSGQEIDRIIQVNITAQFHVTRTFPPGMIERKRGHVVGIASISALHPVSGAVIYSSTKAAMNNMMIALSEEMRQEGNEFVKCTSILPYLVTTRKDIVETANFRFPFIYFTGIHSQHCCRWDTS